MPSSLTRTRREVPVRYRSILIVATLCAAMAPAGAQTLQPGPASEPVTAQAHAAALLHLTASAHREVSNDEFVVTGVVERSDRSSANTQASVNAVLQKVARDAREAGVDCDSGSYDSTRVEDPARPGSPNPPSAHWITRGTVLLRSTDLTRLQTFLARATADLAIERIQSGLRASTREQVLSQLRLEAIARFRQRAEESAHAFAYPSWSVAEVSVQEDGGQPSPRAMVQPVMMARLAAASEAPPPPLTEGRTLVTVQVSGSIRLLQAAPLP